jgi:type I restriction enzyme R subunit
MKFTEAQLEAAIIELLGSEGYPHVLGETLGERSSSCVSSTKDGAGAPSLPGGLIKEDLRAFLAKRYAGDGITTQEIDAVVKKLEGYPAADLYESNMRLASDGYHLKRESTLTPSPSPKGRGESRNEGSREVRRSVKHSNLEIAA